MRKDLPLALLALLIAVGIGIVTAWPYVQNAGLPADNDAELHVYRIAEMGYSLEAGHPYPRWAPDFFHGYGYPIFNYYAPLTYHLGHWLTLGHPERAAEGARLTFIFALIVGAVGAYRLGRLFGGRSGGLLGSLAFATSPYILLINTHIRGDLAETLALAFLPWALWGWELVWRRGGAPMVLAASAATAAVFLSHNLSGLTVVALVAGLGLWRWWIPSGRGRVPNSRGAPTPGHHPSFGWAVAAAAVFVLITAFFWLPFLVERPYIQLEVAGDGHYDFRNHFISPGRLFSPLQRIDRRATAADVPMTTGLFPVVAAAMGSVVALRRRRTAEVGFYVLASAGLLWLHMPASQWFWESVPGFEYYQFPWRFLGPVAASLVPLISMAAVPCVGSAHRTLGRQRDSGRPERSGRFRWCCLWPGLAALIILGGALPGFYPLPWEPGFGFITPETILDVELEGRWRGTTSTNDFVPTTVDVIPGPQPDLLASYRDPPIDRVNRHTLPEGAVVEVLPSDPWVNSFIVRTPEPFLLRLYLFDFPGWHGYIDGEPVRLELAHPEGFVTVPMPAGQHRLEVRFESTPARRWAWALSAAGLVLLVGLSVVQWRRTGIRAAPCLAGDRSSQTLDGPAGAGMQDVDLPAVVGIFVAVGLFVVLRATVLDPYDVLVRNTPLGVAPPGTMGQHASFGDEVELLGYDIYPAVVMPGRTLEVKLVWKAARPVTATYQSFVHLVYPEGKIVSQSDHLNPGGFPTNLWPVDRYVVDRHQLRIPEDAMPGSYLVSVGLFTLNTNARVPVEFATCGGRTDSVTLCDIVAIKER